MSLDDGMLLIVAAIIFLAGLCVGGAIEDAIKNQRFLQRMTRLNQKYQRVCRELKDEKEYTRKIIEG